MHWKQFSLKTNLNRFQQFNDKRNGVSGKKHSPVTDCSIEFLFESKVLVCWVRKLPKLTASSDIKHSIRSWVNNDFLYLFQFRLRINWKLTHLNHGIPNCRHSPEMMWLETNQNWNFPIVSLFFSWKMISSKLILNSIWLWSSTKEDHFYFALFKICETRGST